MFHYVRVPPDLSSHTAQAVDMARDMGRVAGVRITLFQVIETLSGPTSSPRSIASSRGVRPRTSPPLASRFEGSGYGKPAEEIIRFMVHNQVDLTVLASHKVDLSRPGHGWGTLSYTIGVLAPCPVLLVK